MNEPSEVDRPQCFMITPIGQKGSATRKHADWVYRFLGQACKEREIDLKRADTMTGSPMITSRIFEALSVSQFCIADLTDLNANVFYELGIRHSLSKPVIHIAHEGTDLPFDNAQHDTIFFDVSDLDSMSRLESDVGKALDEIGAVGYQVSNPFSAALGAIELQRSGDPRDVLIAKMEERLGQLERVVTPASPSNDPSGGLMSTVMGLLQKPDISHNGVSQLEISPMLVTAAVNEIAPWMPEDAQRLAELIAARRNLVNKEELLRIVMERFPEVRLRSALDAARRV